MIEIPFQAEVDKFLADCLRPLSDEELKTFKPITDEEIMAALEEGRKEMEAACRPSLNPKLMGLWFT